MKVADTYGEPIILNIPNAIVRVYRPILSPEEQAKRMQAIHDAAAELLKATRGRT